MAESAGDIVIEIIPQFGQLDTGLAKAEANAKASTGRMTAAITQFKNAFAGTSATASTVGKGIASATQGIEQSFARTTAAAKTFSAANTAAFAFLRGGAIALVGTAVAGVAAAYVSLAEAGKALRNELSQLPNVSPSREFAFISQLADQTGSSVEALTARYIQLSQQGRDLKLSSEQVRTAFEAEARALAGRREDTVGLSATRLKEALSGVVERLDQSLGISYGIRSVFDYLAQKAKEINVETTQFASALKEASTINVRNLHAALFSKVNELQNELTSARVRDTGPATLGAPRTTRDIATINAELDRARRELAATESEIDVRRKERDNQLKRTADEELRRAGAAKKIIGDYERELTFERSLIGLTEQEQEVKRSLFQLNNSLRESGLSLTKDQTKGYEEQIRTTARLKEQLATIVSATEATVGNMTNALVEFAVTGKFTFKDMADSIVRDLLRIAAQAYVTKPLLNFATGLGGSLLGGTATTTGWTPSVTPAVPGFASGGSFSLPSSMGSQDRPMLLGLAGGEQVDITPAGGSFRGNGAAPIVNLQINSSKEFATEQRSSTGPDGRQMVDLIVTEVSKAVGQGKLDAPLEGRFGVRRRMPKR